jgi:trans-aconitate methyltransferase
MAASPARRIAWRLARELGGRAARWAWDDQFRRGRWQFIADERSPRTVELVARYADGGRIVELGCAEGALAQLLPEGSFSSFHGIDISPVAIERARSRNLERCTFAAMRLEDWSGDRDVACIVAEEVLYYLTPADWRELLPRCLASVAPDGVLLAVVHDAVRYAALMDEVRQCGRIVLDSTEDGRCYVAVARKGK